MPRKSRRRRKPRFDLDAALADVREGKSPLVFGNRYGTRSVIDPFDDPKTAKPREKVVAVRDDPIGFMFSREAIGESQYRAARAYRSCWQALEQGAKAINLENPKVDGGQLADPESERYLQALTEMRELRAVLNSRGRELVHLVCGLDFDLHTVATWWGETEQMRFKALRIEFYQCLTDLAHKKGFSEGVPARGPRRMRDYFDSLSKHIDNPKLYAAMHWAKSA